MKKKILVAILFCVMLLSLCACGGDEHDIVILYTGDVHCAIDENIGYAGLAAYKKQVKSETPYVALVDCGDAIQGDIAGTVSKGEYIVDIMNELNYDIAVLGNHEFDYGLLQLGALMDRSSATYIGANIKFTGTGEGNLKKLVPYKILTFGKTDVAFVGVTTPYTLTSSTPAYFMDNSGKFVYSFTNESADAFYSCVQESVDSARNAGADYVILCAHLGEGAEFTPFSSVELIANTTGVDALLDAHAHSEIPGDKVNNKENVPVVLSSTGTRLTNIGKLIITADGEIKTELVHDFTEKDAEADAVVRNVKSACDGQVNRTVATSSTALTGFDANGVRMTRTRETTVGNFCADAYRAVSGAQIAFVNGGGVRADIPMGQVTMANLMAVHPYGNSLCMVKATGQEILDALEHGCRFTESEYVKDGDAVGESGGFLSVSGLKYTIDTSVKSSVACDENGLHTGIGDTRRVTDVQVLGEDGVYAPIDPAATYTLASHNYMIKNGGDGYTMFSDNELIIDEGIADYQILIDYMTQIGGDLRGYAGVEGRITVK